MEYDYLEYSPNEIPSYSTVPLDGQDYQLKIAQNIYNDGIYFDLFDENGVQLVYGERLIYGKPMWDCIVDPRLPMVNLVPLDPDGNEDTVDASNFPNIVHLYIANTEESDDDLDDDSDNDNDADNIDTDITDNGNSDYGTDETVGDN